jgi:hypothetical protein
VPLDYAHGGVNEVFAAQVTNAGSAPASQSVSLKLYDISYSQLNLGVAVPAPPVAPAPTTVEFGSGPDTLILWTTENAYNGDAQYTIKLDGVQVGGIQTAIAWDGAGMGADKVTVFAVNPGRTGDHGKEPGADIALFLARHGVKAEVSASESGGMEVGPWLLSRAADLGTDLIVMGGYGHSRLRELALGGVTRTMLHHMTVPVLMSH